MTALCAVIAIMSGCRKADDAGVVSGLGGRLEKVSGSGFSLQIGEAAVKLPDSQGEFWISVHEVTQAEFEEVLGYNSSMHRAPDLPVDRVTYGDAVAFCEELTERDRASGVLRPGMIYRLPDQREWLLAAFAGGQLPGRAELDACAWHCLNAGLEMRRGGSRAVNSNGVVDLFGNVAEWASPDADADAAEVLELILAERLAVMEAWRKKEEKLATEAHELMFELMNKSSVTGLGDPMPMWVEPEIGSERRLRSEVESADAQREAEEYRAARDQYKLHKSRLDRISERIEMASRWSAEELSEAGLPLALGGCYLDFPEQLLLPNPHRVGEQREDGIGFRFVMATD